MRVGFTSWLSKTTPVEKIITDTARLGFDGIKIAGYSRDFSKERRRNLRVLLRNHELRTISISAGFPFLLNPEKLNLHSPDDEVTKKSVRYLFKCIDLASDLETGFVYACSVKKESEKKNTEEIFSQSLSECADYAAGAGLSIVLEHVPTGITETFRETIEFSTRSGIKNLGLLLDTGHLAISGERLDTAVLHAGRKLAHVHLNNNDGSKDLHRPPQSGKLTKREFVALIGALGSIEYSGFLSIELAPTNNSERLLQESRDYLLSLMRLE